MMRLLAVLVLATLACGTLAVPPLATATPAEDTPTVANTLAVPSRTPVLLAIEGCWNLREGPSVDAQVANVQCGGRIEFGGWIANGFARVGNLYICGRAFGEAVSCR